MEPKECSQTELNRRLRSEKPGYYHYTMGAKGSQSIDYQPFRAHKG
jgi:hypothetical protein